MGLESVTTITDLVATNPLATDDRSQGDDHIRNLKTAVRSLLAAANLTNLAQIGFPATASGQAGKYVKVAAGEAALEYGALGGAAVLNVGTAAGTVAAGDHTHTLPTAQRAIVSRAANQSVNTGTATALSFDTETLDVGDYYSGGAPTRLTIPATGGYLVLLRAAFSQPAGFPQRRVSVYVNGVSMQSTSFASSKVGDNQLSALLSLTVGDYVELYVWHDDAGSINVTGVASIIRLW